MNRRVAIGLTWILGGALWLVAGLVDAGSQEAIWLPADGLILLGILGLWALDFHDGARPGAIGLGIALAGRLVLIAAEIVSVVQGSDENALLPLGALSSAIGLTVYGISIVRRAEVQGLVRFAPLIAGAYPFVTMFPIVIARSGDPSEVAISIWGAPLAALGLAILSARTLAAGGPAGARVAGPGRAG